MQVDQGAHRFADLGRGHFLFQIRVDPGRRCRQRGQAQKDRRKQTNPANHVGLLGCFCCIFVKLCGLLSTMNNQDRSACQGNRAVRKPSLPITAFGAVFSGRFSRLNVRSDPRRNAPGCKARPGRSRSRPRSLPSPSGPGRNRAHPPRPYRRRAGSPGRWG